MLLCRFILPVFVETCRNYWTIEAFLRYIAIIIVVIAAMNDKSTCSMS